MSESRSDEVMTRPTTCPFCGGKRLDTLAKTFTVRTMWRCRECDQTWTIANWAALPGRLPSTIR
jgi:transposase-like protein